MKQNQNPEKEALRILACFFVSGMAGLIYQVTWSKALGLIFGHTVYAVTVVLAVFMAGLGAGSAWLGKWFEERPRNAISTYAWLEILIAVFGMLSVAGLVAVQSAYVHLVHAAGGSGFALLVLRVVGAAGILFVPTFLMGGTFAILVQGLTRHSAELGKRISQLYWVNTLGAVVGALISGFVLLPALGIRLTIVCAAALNILAALAALPSVKKVSEDGVLKVAPTPSPASVEEAAPALVMVSLAISGATSLGYEVELTRLLAATISNSTYGFTLMLAIFLAGIAIGGALFDRYRSSGREVTLATVGWTQLAIGTAAVAALIFLQWIPQVIPPILRISQETFAGLIVAQVVASILAMLPMAILFGFCFPLGLLLLGDAKSENKRRAETVGRGYAANTLGAIAGALLTGFWLIPWLGSFRAVIAVATVNLVCVAIVYPRRRSGRIAALSISGAVLLAAIAMMASSDFHQRALLNMSAALYGNSYHGRLTLEEIAATTDVVFDEEGLNASVVVLRSDDYVGLRINGKVDASSGDARTQLLLGHLGAAFHPAPKRVLIIGFGSGMTAAAVARYPEVQHIDCVEIEPAVARAGAYFEKLNNRILEDPRLNLIFDDARSFLLTSHDQYDLIISEPSNPWIAGIATLFTDEFYSAVRQRLAAGGMFVQWVQSYSLAPSDLRMIVATLAPHFSETTLWHAEGPDLLLLGRTETSPLRLDHLRRSWKAAGVKKDFEAMDVHQPEGLVGYFLLDDAGVRMLAEGGAKNTDDRTLLEYHAPRTLLARGLTEANHEMIAAVRSGPIPANLDSSEKKASLEAGVLTNLDLDDVDAAKKFLNALEDYPESFARRIALGRIALLQKAYPEAKALFEDALKLDAESLETAHWLAIAEHRAGDDAAARALLDQWINRNPKSLLLQKDKMEFAVDRQDYGVAVLAQMNRLNLMVDAPSAEYCRLGAIWMKAGNLAEAQAAMEKGIAKDSYSYACHLGLGEIYRENKKFSDARREFEGVLRFFPDADATTYRSLAGVDVMLGERNVAKAVLKKGLRVFPEDEALRAAVSMQ
jgi:spermidine synthase